MEDNATFTRLMAQVQGLGPLVHKPEKGVILFLVVGIEQTVTFRTGYNKETDPEGFRRWEALHAYMRRALHMRPTIIQFTSILIDTAQLEDVHPVKSFLKGPLIRFRFSGQPKGVEFDLDYPDESLIPADLAEITRLIAEVRPAA